LKKEKIKNLLYFIGKSLGILGLLFIFYKLSQEYTWSSFTEQFILLIPIVPLLILLNLASLLLGIYGWHLILLHYAQRHFPYLSSYYYFSKTEIAKYLPGNIFHFVGRQALASRIGLTQTHMAKISLLHALFLLTGTLLVSTVFAWFTPDTPLFILLLMALSTIVAFMVLVYLYPSFPFKLKFSLNIQFAISIALQGCMLGAIVLYQTNTDAIDLFFQCISIYTISWLIGFVTPGASGGLGVREGAFIAISSYLQINISEEIIIFSVLLTRLINILVDILLYLSTYMIQPKSVKETP